MQATRNQSNFNMVTLKDKIDEQNILVYYLETDGVTIINTVSIPSYVRSLRRIEQIDKLVLDGKISSAHGEAIINNMYTTETKQAYTMHDESIRTDQLDTAEMLSFVGESETNAAFLEGATVQQAIQFLLQNYNRVFVRNISNNL